MNHLFVRLGVLAAIAVLAAACGESGGSGSSTKGSSGGAGVPAPTHPASGWTWVSGSSTLNAKGVYGTRGVAAAANVPGARTQHVSWVDAADNFWLFGGGGYDANGTQGALNDLWKFDGTQWTWISGSSTVNGAAVYGTKGTPAPANTPGSRCGAAAWTDAGSHLWLFGGTGSVGSHNDLWKFDGTRWTWVSGSPTPNPPGVYGTKGVAAAANVPGGRWMSAFANDAAGNLWVFGGEFAVDSTGAIGSLNDLWKFDGANWTWLSGAKTIRQAGVYGTKGVAAPTNVPGARSQGVGWMDPAGTFWTLGGLAIKSTGAAGYPNDLWKFSGGQWTWVSGEDAGIVYGTCGTKGVPDAANTPGSRTGGCSWSDSAGNLWFFGGSGQVALPAIGSGGNMNDLWKFDGSRWTWVAGEANIANRGGSYIAVGLSPVPGGRFQGASAVDGSGHLWLFGGYGRDASPANEGLLNDLWRYTP
jgi:N-acetylneuraminic acid mutarotase